MRKFLFVAFSVAPLLTYTVAFAQQLTPSQLAVNIDEAIGTLARTAEQANVLQKQNADLQHQIDELKKQLSEEKSPKK